MEELTREKQMEELTCGEKLVDIKSTKATELDVYKVKRLTAELINHLDEKWHQTSNNEVKTLLSLAIIDLQTASMRATQALTWKY